MSSLARIETPLRTKFIIFTGKLDVIFFYVGYKNNVGFGDGFLLFLWPVSDIKNPKFLYCKRSEAKLREERKKRYY